MKHGENMLGAEIICFLLVDQSEMFWCCERYVCAWLCVPTCRLQDSKQWTSTRGPDPLNSFQSLKRWLFHQRATWLFLFVPIWLILQLVEIWSLSFMPEACIFLCLISHHWYPSAWWPIKPVYIWCWRVICLWVSGDRGTPPYLWRVWKVISNDMQPEESGKGRQNWWHLQRCLSNAKVQ